MWVWFSNVVGKDFWKGKRENDGVFAISSFMKMLLNRFLELGRYDSMLVE